MTNEQIDIAVRRITGLFLKDYHPKPVEEECIKAGVDLISNLLQNINDIAYAAVEENERAERMLRR